MELKPCPFCGGEAIAITTITGSTIRCCACSAKMEHYKPGGRYKSLAMARKWSLSVIAEDWNNRA